MPLRLATIEDAPALAALYRDSARLLGGTAYSPAQVDVWASWPDNFADFTRRLHSGVSLVSLAQGEIAAFGQLDPDDHLALLYTGPRFARQGHATATYEALESIARARGVTRIRTTASQLSRPLFEKQGFGLTGVEQVLFKGVEFERFKMEKPLGDAR